MTALAGPAPHHVAVACSGGSDSVALLHLCHDWANHHGVAMDVLTVDHGLRPDAAAETAHVVSLCQNIKRPCTILSLNMTATTGSLQTQARHARHAALARACRDLGVSNLLLAHTADDQAETLWMRLRAGARPDQLGAIAARAPAPIWPDGAGVVLLRPLLQMRRRALQAMLRQRGVDWVDDPSNRDRRHARVRARHALAALPDAISTHLSALGQTLAEIEQMRWQAAGLLAQTCLRPEGGDILLDRALWYAGQPMSRQRLLAAALTALSGHAHGPAWERVVALDQRLCAGQGSRHTLGGCIIDCDAAHIRLRREPPRRTSDTVPTPIPMTAVMARLAQRFDLTPPAKQWQLPTKGSI